MTGSRHWRVEKTDELNQPTYFKDQLTSECKPGCVFLFGKEVLHCFQRSKTMITIKINKD